MPIKLPKVLPRRKSDYEAEDPPTPPQGSSFRVLERPSTKSFDGGQTLKRLSHGRPLSAGNLVGDHLQEAGDTLNYRGSGGTNISASSGGHDNSSSSARYSSTSTLPSSTDIPLDERIAAGQQDFPTMPAPPANESSGISFKSASRAFSFGRKKAESSTPTPRPVVQQTQSDGFELQHARGRALTETSYASGSTATPPRLLDAGLDLDQSDQDGFGSMFDNFGKNGSQTDLAKSVPGLNMAESDGIFQGNSRPVNNDVNKLAPSPLNLDRSRDVGAGPKSWASHNSHEGLMAGTSPMERTFSYEDDVPLSQVTRGIRKSPTMPYSDNSNPTYRKPLQRPPSDGLRRSSLYATKRMSEGESNLFQDADARLVMDSINASRRLDRYSSPGFDDDDDNPAAALVSQSRQTPSPYAAQGPSRMPENRQRSPKPFTDDRGQARQSSWQQESASTTPRAGFANFSPYEERSLFDASPESMNTGFSSARPPIQPPQRPQTQNKIMTPAEFERYRREQEMKSTADPKSKDDSSDDEGDDDEDEIEKSKQAARQRRKQEAHMSVYRQQMMKVTGEQPSDLPNLQLRPGMDRASASAPTLGGSTSIPEINFDKPVEETKTSDDEDEDVPLGVLAAHGFPSKTRPPGSGGPPTIQYKSETYPPPPASSNGASSRSPGLPPFAKNLPPDPYYGAGLVNPANREPLSYGHQGPGSSHGSTSHPVHPAGLVGVINAEEQARAARRGSPNPQGSFGSPLPPGMMPPGMPPVMTPGEQATVQMSEQMTQMMHMQMQWMQQMQQMMAQGMMPGQQQPPFMPPQMPGMPQMPMGMNLGMPPVTGQMPRPVSTGSHSTPGVPNGARPNQSRAMSMTGPAPSQQWQSHGFGRQSASPSAMSGQIGQPGPDYTPSIAPSERSNVGMPSRYRPVSIAPADEYPRSRSNPRTSTFTEGSLQPGSTGQPSRLSSSGDRAQSRLSSLRPVSTTPPRKAASDDDDEEGWAEMKRKKDKKKSTWRLNQKKEEPQPQFDVYDYPEDA